MSFFVIVSPTSLGAFVCSHLNPCASRRQSSLQPGKVQIEQRSTEDTIRCRKGAKKKARMGCRRRCHRRSTAKKGKSKSLFFFQFGDPSFAPLCCFSLAPPQTAARRDLSGCSRRTEERQRSGRRSTRGLFLSRAQTAVVRPCSFFARLSFVEKKGRKSRRSERAKHEWPFFLCLPSSPFIALPYLLGPRLLGLGDVDPGQGGHEVADVAQGAMRVGVEEKRRRNELFFVFVCCRRRTTKPLFEREERRGANWSAATPCLLLLPSSSLEGLTQGVPEADPQR